MQWGNKMRASEFVSKKNIRKKLNEPLLVSQFENPEMDAEYEKLKKPIKKSDTNTEQNRKITIQDFMEILRSRWL